MFNCIYCMLPWIFLAGRTILLAYERIVVKKLGTGASPLAAAFLFFFLGALALLPFALALERVSDWSFLAYVAVTGTLIAVADVLYIYALSNERVSLIAPLYNLNIVFLLVLAVAIAHDSFTLPKMFGTLLIFGGAFVLQRAHFPDWRDLLRSGAVKAIILSGFIFALLRAIDAMAFKSLTPPPITYATLMYLVASLVYLLALVVRREFGSAIGLLKAKPGIALQSGLVNGFSYLFLLLAIARIEVSIAEPIAMLSMPLAVFLAQREFQERPAWEGVLLMLAGAWVLFL